VEKKKSAKGVNPSQMLWRRARVTVMAVQGGKSPEPNNQVMIVVSTALVFVGGCGQSFLLGMPGFEPHRILIAHFFF
jgi:hypothetical protein